MGGAMLWKVLWDYHKKIENMFTRYSKGHRNLLNLILNEIEVYTTIEEEVLYPNLSGVAGSWQAQSQDQIDLIKELSADIQNLEPGDPAEAKLVRRLEKVFLLHAEREQKHLFPVLKHKGQLEHESYEMARNAFTVRQELITARGGNTPSSQYFIGLPNSGWTKALVAGGGW